MSDATQPDKPERLFTTAEMALADAAAVVAGTPIETLITRAGAAVAEHACALRRGEGPVAILCGPGHNGADGHLAAAALVKAGVPVSVFREPRDQPRPVMSWAAGCHGLPVQPLARFRAASASCIVDALYGAGLSRPLFGIEAEAIAWIAAAAAPVLAVDVPSGLDGDTGQPLGPCAPADRTITFMGLKPGHLLWPGRHLCGDVRVADIGIKAAPAGASAVWINAPALWSSALPAPDPAGHKYTRGHVLVLSGPEFRTGAARLSAIAALRAGAGAVTLAGEPDALRVHAAHVTAIMLAPVETIEGLTALLASRPHAAAVIGPAAGIGDHTVGLTAALLTAAIPTVLDADALTSLAGHAGRLARRPRAGSPLVLTPHEGEFARLFEGVLHTDPSFAALPTRHQRSKVERARAAARIVNGTIVLKGIDTVVADQTGQACIALNGGPELATAGSGDVLAGIIASHLAMGLPPFAAAAAGVWLHAETGRSLGYGLTADDLAAGVRPLLRRGRISMPRHGV